MKKENPIQPMPHIVGDCDDTLILSTPTAPGEVFLRTPLSIGAINRKIRCIFSLFEHDMYQQDMNPYMKQTRRDIQEMLEDVKVLLDYAEAHDYDLVVNS